MKELQCELCGSTDIIKQEGVFVCQSCNTKYSLEEAKKMMFGNTTQTVEIDSTSELEKLYKIARRAKESNNNVDALNYYNQIIVKDPDSWEAQFYVVYCRAQQSSIGGIVVSANSILNCLKPVLNLVKEHVTDKDKQKEVIDEISNKVFNITQTYFVVAKNHYDNKISDLLKQRNNKYVQDYVNRCYSSSIILYELGDLLISLFNEEYSNFAVISWKKAIEYHNQLMSNFANKEPNQSKINKYADKILKYDSAYIRPVFKSSKSSLPSNDNKKGFFGRFR